MPGGRDSKGIPLWFGGSHECTGVNGFSNRQLAINDKKVAH